jgi:hypothetical protein
MAEGDLGLLSGCGALVVAGGRTISADFIAASASVRLLVPVHLIVFMSTLITPTYEPRSPERSHSPKAMRLHAVRIIGLCRNRLYAGG